MQVYRSKFFLRVVLLSFALVALVLVGPAIAFGHSVNNLVETEAKTQLYDTITRIAEHVDDGTLPLDVVLSILPDGLIIGDWESTLDRYTLTADQRRILEAEHILFYREHKGGYYEVIAEIGGGYVTISADAGTTLSQVSHQTMRGVWFSLFASMVVIFMGSRFILRPMAELTEASRKIAGGDLSVRVSGYRNPGEVGDLMQSFNDMVEGLGKVEILRSGFVSDVSHEFKIPLTTISGYAKLLQDTDSTEERREYTDIIMEESGHLVKLVDNILMLGRLDQSDEGSKLTYPAERIELAEQIRRALAIYEPIWSEKAINLQVSLSEAYTFGYDTLLKQVWSNLIDNAVKFTPQGGQITLRLESRVDTVHFLIQNSGGGIPEDARLRIFDKFYKQDPSRHTEGNGLGLAIAKRIVEVHNGRIGVASIPGQGAEFTVSLPKAPNPA